MQSLYDFSGLSSLDVFPIFSLLVERVSGREVTFFKESKENVVCLEDSLDPENV